MTQLGLVLKNEKIKRTEQSKAKQSRTNRWRRLKLIMEGNLKKMARSKRASSQRSKAKHSKHGGHGGVVSAVTREKAIPEDLLPSNWERYGDESGSDEDLAPLAEGEVRPKSKGADYGELLSLDVPQLFEESPEMEGMTAMLLENGLGLWDWDSSYLEPSSLSSEQQAAREASALLTVDMRLLGKSLARLNLAQRLFLEDELFLPMQKQAEDGSKLIDTSTRISDSEGAATSMKDALAREHRVLSEDTSFGTGSLQANAEFPFSALPSGTSCINGSSTDYLGDRISTSSEDTSLSVNFGDLVTNSASTARGAWENSTDIKEQRRVENSKEPTEVKRFEATAAEAELDDLLDMLDNEVAGVSLKTVSQVNLPRMSTSETTSFSPSYPASSSPSSVTFQESRMDYKPREIILEPVLRVTPKNTGAPSHSAPKFEKTNPSNSAKGAGVLLSQDDDFDSWLDSI